MLTKLSFWPDFNLAELSCGESLVDTLVNTPLA
jgi:hypothetical protein